MKSTEIKAWVREVVVAHRKAMAEDNITFLGLCEISTSTAADLYDAKKLLETEQRKASKMARKTADWRNSREVYKVAYLIHDANRFELEHMVEELDRDLKTLKSRRAPHDWTPESYAKHYWNVDIEVYIYDESDLTDEEVDMYVDAVEKTLKGEYHMEIGGLGDRGFGFYADDADWDKLEKLLTGLERRGCIIEYPDWNEWLEDYKA